MDQTKKNAVGLDGRRKVVVMGEGAAGCFMCVKRFESIKDLYDHISAGHSDSEWKAFFAQHKTTIINVGGRNKDLLSGWKVTGKRGRPELKVIDEELLELAECLLLLASGPPKPPSTEVEEAGVKALMKTQQDSTAGGCHDQIHHPSKEVEAEVEAAAMEDNDFKFGFMVAQPQRLDADFKGCYFVVYDFDMHEDPTTSTPPHERY